MTDISWANSGTGTEKPLAGAVALVTGGGRGIGKAIAQRLAKLGAAVSICGRTEESLMRTAQELRVFGVRVHARTGDVTQAGFFFHDAAATEKELGPISILVNNAGIGG